MFGLFKKEPPPPLTRLFRITVHIGRGSNDEMPPNLIGAYVPVFVGASDHEDAATKAVRNLTSQGFEFIDIADGQIHELDPTKWDSFVQEAWPEFKARFPNQTSVLSGLKTELLFTGPFASYETPRNA